jgi:hypothetical protein
VVFTNHQQLCYHRQHWHQNQTLPIHPHLVLGRPSCTDEYLLIDQEAPSTSPIAPNIATEALVDFDPNNDFGQDLGKLVINPAMDNLVDTSNPLAPPVVEETTESLSPPPSQHSKFQFFRQTFKLFQKGASRRDSLLQYTN